MDRRKKAPPRKKSRFYKKSISSILLFSAAFFVLRFWPAGKHVLTKILTESVDILSWTEKISSLLPK